MRTSYSSIETFRQCPQKYKFQEIDRVRAPKSPEAVFGGLIHDALKFMFKSDPLFPALDEVIDHFRNGWKESFGAAGGDEKIGGDSAGRRMSEEAQKIYFAEGVKMLKNFYEKNAPWNFNVIDLESRFEVAVTDEKSGQVHILAGIIDRIDKLADGVYEIIDYKTAKRMPSQEEVSGNLQLALYSLGLRKRWPHLRASDIKLSLYFLKHGEKLSAAAAPEILEKTRSHLLKTIREIQEHISSGKFEPMPGPLCDWCGYKPICPAWKHLYGKLKSTAKDQNEMEETIQEYFEIKKAQRQNDAKLNDLQKRIKEYMEEKGLTRVFGEEGVISKTIIRRWGYDWDRVKSILSPIGKWEEILGADEARLRKILLEIPEETRRAVGEARKISKEYVALVASAKPAEIAAEDESRREKRTAEETRPNT